MRYSLILFALFAGMLCNAQSLGVRISSSTGEGPLGDLYKFLNVDRYEAKFSGAKSRKYNVLVVMRAVDKDGSHVIDTMINTGALNDRVQGHEAFKWQPSTGASFMAQRTDSLHVKITCDIGTSHNYRIYPIEPGRSYAMNEGVFNFKGPVDMPLGKSVPIIVYTQPYPDPPPPKKAVFYRYCFGSDEPPDQWPKVFGVPHLLILEMTVLP